MIWTLPEDERPNRHLFACGTTSRDGIRRACEDFMTAYRGIEDFVGILDSIQEDAYTLSEAMTAGTIVAEAPDGYLISGERNDPANWRPAKYININGLDTVLLKDSGEVLSGKDLTGCLFEERTGGKRYRLSSTKRIPKKTRADRANSQPSEDGKPSTHKESLPSSAPKCKKQNTAAAHSRERKRKQ